LAENIESVHGPRLCFTTYRPTGNQAGGVSTQDHVMLMDLLIIAVGLLGIALALALGVLLTGVVARINYRRSKW
jgi:hypothetical protein